METNVIYNSDCIKAMNDTIPAESIDLIFADPPYWMRVDGVLTRVEGTEFDGCNDEWDQFESLDSYENFTRDWLKACYRVLKPNGSIWVIGGMQCIYTIGAIMQELGYWIINDVVWHKKNPTPNFMGTRLNNSHETMIWATKGKLSKYTFNYKTAKELNTDTVSEEDYAKGKRKQMGSVWRFSVCSGTERLKDCNGEKLHSTQKPQEMLERIIAISSKYGDIVLDPFGGTMTTAAAAKKLGRKYIMIEREEKYCKYGEDRLKNITFENSPVATAAFDEKPIKVTISEMIKAGFFTVDEGFYFRDGKEQIATLNSNGKLNYNGEEIDIHSCAAIARNAKAKRLNGFDYWFVLRNDQLVSIADVRDNYRAQNK